MHVCRKCGGSGWYGPRTDLGRALGNTWKGGPCRAPHCVGGRDDRWSEKACRNCYSTIEYRTDWSHVPDYCENCRKDQYKSCANPHCSGTVRYKVFWDHIPDYCQCKGWYTTTCQNPHCGQQFQASCRWTDPPKYCKTCKGWYEYPCGAGCGTMVRAHCEWSHPPTRCQSCKSKRGTIVDTTKRPVRKWRSMMMDTTIQHKGMTIHIASLGITQAAKENIGRIRIFPKAILTGTNLQMMPTNYYARPKKAWHKTFII